MFLLFIVTFAADILLMFSGYKLSLLIKSRKCKLILSIIFFIFCLPAVAFLAFPLPMFREPIWFLKFRTVKGVEILSAFWGLFIGFVTVKSCASSKVRWKMFNKYFYIIGILLIVPQYIDYLALPVNYDRLQSNWVSNVCIQSEGFTCAPASLATVFRYLGQDKTEAEIAKSVYTSRSGTSRYEIIRFAKENGMKVKCLYEKDLSRIPVPSILEVEVLGGIQHVIVYMGMEGERYIIGEPLEGRLLLSREEFFHRYVFDGFVINIKRNDRGPVVPCSGINLGNMFYMCYNLKLEWYFV